MDGWNLYKRLSVPAVPRRSIPIRSVFPFPFCNNNLSSASLFFLSFFWVFESLFYYSLLFRSWIPSFLDCVRLDRRCWPIVEDQKGKSHERFAVGHAVRLTPFVRSFVISQIQLNKTERKRNIYSIKRKSFWATRFVSVLLSLSVPPSLKSRVCLYV